MPFGREIAWSLIGLFMCSIGCSGTIVDDGPSLADAAQPSAPDAGAALPTAPDADVADSSSTNPVTDGRLWIEPLQATGFHIDFDIVNPYVPGFGSCFGVNMNQLVHAGEDRAIAAGTIAKAVGPGTVVYSAITNYPGGVVVVEHALTASEKATLETMTGEEHDFVYSMYGHLGTISAAVGQTVETGQTLGTILNQGGNSHLHWEMRTVQVPQLCGYNMPGPGYTGPGTTATSYGYLDPTLTIDLLSND